MKFEITMDDFWLDSEEDVMPAIKQHVIHEVSLKISKSIIDKANQEIAKAVSKSIDDTLIQNIQLIIDEFIKSGKVKERHGSNEVPVDEYIKKTFDATGWGTINETVSKVAKLKADELKRTYDLQFATHIVNRIRDVGMLKDDVAQMLLENPKKDT